MDRSEGGFRHPRAGDLGPGGAGPGAVLTVVEDTVAGVVGEVVIDVASETLRDAMLFTAQTAGWKPRRTLGPDTVLVTDFLHARPPTGSRRTVLVVEPTPLAARDGMRALACGRVATLLCSDRTSDLRTALGALSEGWTATPARVVRLASEMPDLTARQLDMVASVVGGRTNVDISRELHISLATVKRELAVVGVLLGAASRTELVQTARRLGVRPRTSAR